MRHSAALVGEPLPIAVPFLTASPRHLDDGTDEIAECGSTGAVTTRYIPGPAIDEPIALVTVSGGAKEFFHANLQGSVIAMSNATGALSEGPFI